MRLRAVLSAGPGARRIGRHRTLAGIVTVGLAVFVLTTAGAAGAAGSLDQSQTGSDFTEFLNSPVSSVGVMFAQTFTPGITGNLSQVDLVLGQGINCVADAPLDVAIETTSGGLPSNSAIASASLPQASVPTAPDWTSVQFSPAPAVAAGVQYAIVLSSEASNCTNGGPPYEWRSNHGGGLATYSGGQFAHTADAGAHWLLDNWEGTFRTYVVTPSDQAATLVGDARNVKPGTALTDKALAIQTAVDAGQTATACANITQFLGLVKAQTAKKLTTSTAALLTTDANNLAAALGC